MTRLPKLLPVVMCAFVTGCGGGDAPNTPPADSYLPLAIGASWTYQITDPVAMTVTQKTTSVEAFEDVGGTKAGTTAFRVRTDKAGGGYTLSWQAYSGALMERHREQTYSATTGLMKAEDNYEPYKLVVDESPAHLAVGATYDDVYTDVHFKVSTGLSTSTPTTERWTVVAIDEAVTVPAGTFTCLHLRRVEPSTGSTKDYWFASGVGKIRELGASGRVEALVAFTP